MLRYVPGVWAESYNGNDDVFYSSRGSNLDATDYDKNGVKFLQDGLPVTTADGNNHNRALDPMNARYVTVAHGANALAYGASTLGGAIDVTSPTARTTAPLARRSPVAASASGVHARRWAACRAHSTASSRRNAAARRLSRAQQPGSQERVRERRLAGVG